jgi:hypothetical protein
MIRSDRWSFDLQQGQTPPYWRRMARLLALPMMLVNHAAVGDHRLHGSVPDLVMQARRTASSGGSSMMARVSITPQWNQCSDR